MRKTTARQMMEPLEGTMLQVEMPQLGMTVAPREGMVLAVAALVAVEMTAAAGATPVAATVVAATVVAAAVAVAAAVVEIDAFF